MQPINFNTSVQILAFGNIHAGISMWKLGPTLHWKPGPRSVFLSDCSFIDSGIHEKEKIY